MKIVLLVVSALLNRASCCSLNRQGLAMCITVNVLHNGPLITTHRGKEIKDLGVNAWVRLQVYLSAESQDVNHFVFFSTHSRF